MLYKNNGKHATQKQKIPSILDVLDVPNPPQMRGVTCNKKHATINWMPMGDNRAQILRYIIEYNTTFTPDTWEVMYDQVPAADMTYNVSIPL